MKQILTLFLLLSLFGSSVYGQDSNKELLKKLVEKNVLTQTEADELQKSADSTKNVKDENAFTKTKENIHEVFSNIPFVKLGGYGMLMYQYKQYDEKNHHDAKVRVVFISVNGKITKNLSYTIFAELVDPSLYEYYVDWAPSKAFGIKGGQMKVPFTIENPISLTRLETVVNTRSISNLAGMAGDPIQLNNGKNKTGRDLGIYASGSFLDVEGHNLIEYVAGVFQGEGMNTSDRNNTKDFTGTLMLQLIKNLKVGAGVYAGKATYVKPSGTVEAEHVRNRWALMAEYQNDRFYGRSEWIHANDAGIKKEGLYALGTYYVLPKKMNVLAKVDYYNRNKDTHSEVVDYTIGANYYFWNMCRFQLNYTYSDYSKKWGTSYNSENAVYAQMQIVF